jgi:hypothetical protein
LEVSSNNSTTIKNCAVNDALLYITAAYQRTII